MHAAGMTSELAAISAIIRVAHPKPIMGCNWLKTIG